MNHYSWRASTLIFGVGLVLGLAGVVRGEEKTASWFKATPVAERVWVIDDHGVDNIYLVEGKTKALLIDTGIGMGDLPKFVQSITSLPVTVVNTHGHPDHAGGNYQFQTVAAHPADFEMIGLYTSKESLKTSAARFLAGPAIEGRVSLADIEASRPAELRAIKQGDVFDLGDRKLEVVEVPGHTKGSICLLDAAHKLLFTGDNDNQLVWLFLKDCTPLDVYLRTLEKLQARNAEYETILPGHGGPLGKDFLDDQIGCVRIILDGSCKGDPYQSFAGTGRICRYKRAAVAFDPERLHSEGTGSADDGWEPLFNGRDLTGWKANVSPEAYSVVDGVLVVHDTSPTVRSHLFFVGDGKQEYVRYKNFELRLLCRGGAHSNSGVFFHTDFSERDDRKHLAKGYEVQLNNSEQDKRKTGSLYQIVDLDRSPVDDTQWFEMQILVNGKRIAVSIAGKTVVDYTEPENPQRSESRRLRVLDPRGGAIAIQAHDADSTWYFKEIKIRRLPD